MVNRPPCAIATPALYRPRTPWRTSSVLSSKGWSGLRTTSVDASDPDITSEWVMVEVQGEKQRVVSSPMV